jgi:hypothetical protein
MEKGSATAPSLDSIRKEVEQTGKTEAFYEYLYHMHNVDRMSLKSKARAQAKQLLKANPILGELNKRNALQDVMAKVDANISQVSFDEVLDKDLLEQHSDLFDSESLRSEAATDLLAKLKELVKLSKVENKPVFGYSVTADMSRKEAPRRFCISELLCGKELFRREAELREAPRNLPRE